MTIYGYMIFYNRYISYIIIINTQSNVHDIDMKEICITYKKMDFLIIFSGYIIPATSYGS